MTDDSPQLLLSKKKHHKKNNICPKLAVQYQAFWNSEKFYLFCCITNSLDDEQAFILVKTIKIARENNYSARSVVLNLFLAHGPTFCEQIFDKLLCYANTS